MPRKADCLDGHRATKASPEAFLAATTRWAELDDGTERLLLGNCRDCLSTIAYEVGPTTHVRAAPADAKEPS